MSLLSVTTIDEVSFEKEFCKSRAGHESHTLPPGCQERVGLLSNITTIPPFKVLPEAERLLAGPAAQIKLTERLDPAPPAAGK